MGAVAECRVSSRLAGPAALYSRAQRIVQCILNDFMLYIVY